MITKNQVYTIMTQALPNTVYCTQYYEIVPKSLPCVYFRASWNPIIRHINLDYSDIQKRMVVYIEVYGTNIDSIVSSLETVFKSMYFVEELAEMIPNYDPSIERVSMRFSRVITDKDTLGTEE